VACRPASVFRWDSINDRRRRAYTSTLLHHAFLYLFQRTPQLADTYAAKLLPSNGGTTIQSVCCFCFGSIPTRSW
jgi:hypothetical protein